MQRDSLDLDQIQLEIQQEQAQLKRAWRNFRWFVAACVVVGLLIPYFLNPIIEDASFNGIPGLITEIIRLTLFIAVGVLFFRTNALKEKQLLTRFKKETQLPVLKKFSTFTVNMFLAFVVLPVFYGMMALLGMPILISIVLGLAVLIWGAIGKQLLFRRIFSAIYRGDYKKGLSLVVFWEKWFPEDAFLRYLKAGILGFAAQECNSVFQSALEKAWEQGNIRLYTLILSDKSYFEMLQGDFANSLSSLESVIRIEPTFGPPYDNLAYWYLAQGLDSNRALELSRLGVAFTNKKMRGSYANQLATYARALVVTGNSAEGNQVLQQVLKIDLQDRISYAASVSWQIGYVTHDLGQYDQAHQYFEQAISFDPQGIYGQLAKKALNELNQP